MEPEGGPCLVKLFWEVNKKSGPGHLEPENGPFLVRLIKKSIEHNWTWPPGARKWAGPYKTFKKSLQILCNLRSLLSSLFRSFIKRLIKDVIKELFKELLRELY